jgi:hypothetical protein
MSLFHHLVVIMHILSLLIMDHSGLVQNIDLKIYAMDSKKLSQQNTNPQINRAVAALDHE